MQYRSIIRILGLLIAIFSISMLPPAFVAYWYKDGAGVPFMLSFVLSLVIGSFVTGGSPSQTIQMPRSGLWL